MKFYQFYRLAGDIRIRQEHFGGIIFNTKTGMLVEVDREAFALFIYLRTVPVTRRDISRYSLCECL
jgi:hypothetical protein